MTIRSGDEYAVSGLNQFMIDLDVDWQEMAQALPVEKRTQILEDENEMRAEAGEEEATAISDIRDAHLAEHVKDAASTADHIENVLAARDREYVHRQDMHVHYIVELAPLADGVPTVVRKTRIENAELTVTTVEEPSDLHAAISDALPGADVHDYDIIESFTVAPYGGELLIGNG